MESNEISFRNAFAIILGKPGVFQFFKIPEMSFESRLYAFPSETFGKNFQNAWMHAAIFYKTWKNQTSSIQAF